MPKHCTACSQAITGDEVRMAMHVEKVMVMCPEQYEQDNSFGCCLCGRDGLSKNESAEHLASYYKIPLRQAIGELEGHTDCPTCKGHGEVNANGALHAHMLDHEPLCVPCYSDVEQTFNKEDG